MSTDFLIKTVIVLLVLPIVVSIMSIDVAMWRWVIEDMSRGQYFGSFKYFGQPIDTALQVCFLVLLSLPILLAVIWILQRLFGKGKRI